MRHVFGQFLSRLAANLSLEGLKLDDANQCFLFFDDKFIVRIEWREESGFFSFVSKLGNVEEGKTVRMYPQLLEANLLWVRTNGAIFGLQSFSELILLSQHIPLDRCTSYEDFEKTLETFVNTTEYWSENLDTLTDKPIKQGLEEVVLYGRV
ncbi:MAG: type III secretion system chaperone [Puniceicoccales bacterium]|jgi:hypothetical protein|nr:type III secretion system chaperone [Puniceicoccales bacterium]